MYSSPPDCFKFEDFSSIEVMAAAAFASNWALNDPLCDTNEKKQSYFYGGIARYLQKKEETKRQALVDELRARAEKSR